MNGDTQYFLRDRNRVTGPFDLPQLQAMKRRGRLARFHQLSSDRRNWVGAETIPGLFDAASDVVEPGGRPADALSYGIVPPPPPGGPASTDARCWFYGAGQQPEGPVTASDLRAMIHQGTLGPDSLVWREGMPSWQPAAILPEFSAAGVDRDGTTPALSGSTTGRSTSPRRLAVPAIVGIVLLLVISGAIVAFRPETLDPLLGKSVVSGPNDQDRISRAIGLVVCGWSLTLKDGTVRDMMDGTGTSFAVTADGYLLTNKHVVEAAARRTRMADDYVVTDFLSQVRPGFQSLAEEISKEGTAVTTDDVSNAFRNTLQSIEPKVWIFLGARSDSYQGTIIHLSDDFDLAILKVDRASGPYFRFAPSEQEIERGRKVYALGFPGSAMHAISEEEFSLELNSAGNSIESRLKDRDFSYTMTDGIVSKISDEQIGRRWIQHTATITAGNSGGPLVDDRGRVLAINTQYAKGQGDGAPTLYSLAMPQMMNELSAHIPSLGR